MTPNREGADATIIAARAGQRITGEHSLHTASIAEAPAHPHRWRTIYCNGRNDVNECATCGQQAVHLCDFEDDYS